MKEKVERPVQDASSTDPTGKTQAGAVQKQLRELTMRNEDLQRRLTELEIAHLILLIHSSGDFRKCMSELTAALKEWSECQAVGVRLRAGDDYPYYETLGFPSTFVEAENQLCAYGPDGKIMRDGAGNPVFECMCGNILSGRFDPALPFFTAHGSFWSNNTTALLASTTDADRQTRTRNRCNGEGYESVALIPLHAGENLFGLIQFNDHRPDRFTPDLIARFEKMADSLAMVLAKRQTEEALRESEERYRTVADFTYDWEYWMNPDGDLVYVSPSCERITGLRPEELQANPALLIAMIHPEDRPKVVEHLQNETSREVGHLEFRIIDQNGGELWISHNCQPVYDVNGRFIGRRVSNRDINDRKRAEIELQKTSERLSLAQQSAGAGLWDWEMETELLTWSPELFSLFGLDPKDVNANFETWRNVLHPQDLHVAQIRIDDAIRDHKSLFSEYRIILPTGEVRWISALGKTTYDERGKAVRMSGICLDITERKRAEKGLQESEEKYRNLFDNAVVGMYRSRIDGSAVLEANQALCDIFGCTREELLSEPATIRWADPSARDAMIQQIKKNGGVTNFEADFVAKSGEIRNCLASVKLYPDEGYLEGTTIDITAHRRAEKNYRILFREMLDGFALHEIICDKEGRPVDYRFLAINPAFERLTGLAAEEIVGRTVLEALPGTESHWIETYGRVALTGEPAVFENYHSQLQKHFEVTAFRPAPNQFACIFADITDRKQAEAEKIKLEGQFHQAQKMESVGRLAGGVAHDFNNMLGIIIGHAEMALDHVDPSQPLFADLREIRKAAERSANLTQQLLAFARKQTVTLRMLDLNEIIEGMLKMLRRLIGEDIVLVWLPGPEGWPIKMDPSQIDQILANLCVNARDAIADVGKITIETANRGFDTEFCARHAGFIPGDYVHLSVSDNGCGMGKDILDKLFEPFFTTKEMGKGTGLGLATVFGIVKQNNGFVNVHSEPGQGTTFNIYLPRHVGKTEQKPKEALAEPIVRGQETILLVEDELAILKMTAIMLEKQGYRVLSAKTPGEAIRLAREHAGQIHLLMTDVVMPEMNGRDLAKNLLSLYPQIKRLFMSGYTADVIAHHGVLEEGVCFIQKPFYKKDLAAKVREALDR